MMKCFRLLVIVILVFCVVYPVSSAIVNSPVRSVPPGRTGPVYVYVTPNPTPKPATYLTVEVSPPNATISIDGGHGSRFPIGSPLTGSNYSTKSVKYSISPGTHTVKVTATGYLPKTERIQINNGDASYLSISLDKNPDYVEPVTLASFWVTSRPTGASVYIDEQLNGTTPCTITAPVGPHTVALRLEGYQDRAEAVEIRDMHDRTPQKVFWILTEEEVRGSLSRPVQTETQKHTVASASPAVTTTTNPQQEESADLLQHIIYLFRGLFGGLLAL